MKRIVCAAALLMLACYPAAATADPPPTLASSAGCGTAAAQPVPVTKVLTIILENTDLEHDHRLAGRAEHERPRDCLRPCDQLPRHPVPEPAELHRAHVRAGAAGDRRGRRNVGVDCQPSPTCQSPTRASSPRSARPRPPRPIRRRRPRGARYAESMPANCGLANVRRVRRPAQPRRLLPQRRGRVRRVRRALRHAGRRRARDRPGRGHAPELRRSSSRTCATTATTRATASAASPRRTRPSRAWMPSILASPDYQSGHLLVVITADTSSSASNGNRSPPCS